MLEGRGLLKEKCFAVVNLGKKVIKKVENRATQLCQDSQWPGDLAKLLAKQNDYQCLKEILFDLV